MDEYTRDIPGVKLNKGFLSRQTFNAKHFISSTTGFKA